MSWAFATTRGRFSNSSPTWLERLEIPAASTAAMSLLRRCSWLFLVTAIATASAPSRATTLAFDLTEIAAGTPQPVDGISVAGVTFGFEVADSPSMDATYGYAGPPSLSYLTGGMLEGLAEGTLTLTFDTDVSLIEFGVALNTIGTVPNGLMIELLDGDLLSLGTTSVELSTMGFFSEAFFSSGEGEFGGAVLTFDSSFAIPPGGDHRFLLDNLNFVQIAAVPEPSTALLLSLGIGAMVARGRPRQPLAP